MRSVILYDENALKNDPVKSKGMSIFRNITASIEKNWDGEVQLRVESQDLGDDFEEERGYTCNLQEFKDACGIQNNTKLLQHLAEKFKTVDSVDLFGYYCAQLKVKHDFFCYTS